MKIKGTCNSKSKVNRIYNILVSKTIYSLSIIRNFMEPTIPVVSSSKKACALKTGYSLYSRERSTKTTYGEDVEPVKVVTNLFVVAPLISSKNNYIKFDIVVKSSNQASCTSDLKL